MRVENLKKANKIYQQITDLDAEILKIEKFAMLVSEGRAEVKFSMDFEIHSEKLEKQKADLFDEDGSLRKIQTKNPLEFGFDFRSFLNQNQSATGGLISQGGATFKETKSNSITHSMSDIVSLQVLGILLNEKLNQREKLIKQIEKL